MKTIIAILIALLPLTLSAQVSLDRQVIGATGGEGGNSNLNVSYTVGETVVETFATSSITLTQGFQQPSATIVGIAQPTGPAWEVKQFPNPAMHQFTLQLDGDYTGSIQLRIVNVEGRLIYQTTIEKGSVSLQEQIDVSRWAAGQYFLTLQADGQVSETLPIQKIN